VIRCPGQEPKVTAQIFWFLRRDIVCASELRKEAGEARRLATYCRDTASLRDLANYASALERAAVDTLRRVLY